MCSPCECPRSAAVAVDDNKALAAAFQRLLDTPSDSLLKKHLTPAMFEVLKSRRTTYGATLLDVIRTGVENPDSGVGLYASDPEAYIVFADLFDAVIMEYHIGFGPTSRQPAQTWGDGTTLSDLDPSGKYVVSTRVRIGRTLVGFPFSAMMTQAQYKEIEEKVKTVLLGLKGEFKGEFYPLTGMSKEVQQRLVADHFLFKEGDRFLKAANATRFWPTGRGIFYNSAKNFLVWVNEEDHMRVISMQPGGDLGAVYRRLHAGIADIDGSGLHFALDSRLGYLTFCPTNLGTTMRASVHIRLPNMAKDKKELERVAALHNLQVRGTSGEHSDTVDGVYDISNKRRMGLTEYEAVKELHDGVKTLINMERNSISSKQ